MPSRWDREFATQWQEALRDGLTVQDFARNKGKSVKVVLDRRSRVEEALDMEMPDLPDVGQPHPEVGRLERVVKVLEAENIELRQKSQEIETLKRFIYGLDQEICDKPPTWIREPLKRGVRRGTPTLFLSDLHWAEYVDPVQVNGLNRYSLKIAHQRLEHIFQTSLKILLDEFSSPSWPGIVVPLGGDMVSGNIHEELRETNEIPIMESIADLHDQLIAGIDMLAEHFPKIFVPCVVGNHGRLDRKPRMKGGVRDNYEWGLYAFLRRHYLKNDRVDVVVSESFDYQYRLHGHGYLLNHGDKAFSGGTGITGPLLPWARGDQKKRRIYEAVGSGYDTLIIGHWHQLCFLGPRDKVIVNGSLKGYDEYAMGRGFEFEQPQQALWITHPGNGITYRLGLLAEPNEATNESWIEVPAAA